MATNPTCGKPFGACEKRPGHDDECGTQDVQWLTHQVAELSKGRCPHSGLPGPECKAHICDCNDFETIWGVSQK